MAAKKANGTVGNLPLDLSLQQSALVLTAPKLTGIARAPLFHPPLLRERLNGCTFPHDIAIRHAEVLKIRDAYMAGKLATKEVSLHGQYLQHVFSFALGYRTSTEAGAHWDIQPEAKFGTMGKSADAGLGLYRVGQMTHIAPLELKGIDHPLDMPRGRRLSPVEQAWDYANNEPTCRWILVSNYNEIRLYARKRGPEMFESWTLEKLADLDEFKRFWFLCSRDQLLPKSADAQSPTDELLDGSAQSEKLVEDKLYARYKAIRNELYADLKEVNSNRPALEMLAATQTILDRILFIAFAEYRGLLPRKLLSDAIDTSTRFNSGTKWPAVRALFRWIDVGWQRENVHAYNGGLFRYDARVDECSVSDELCLRLRTLLEFNYAEEVSVEVLGHIFEQSISDLEEKRKDAGGGDVDRKRKKEGVFYTPPYVTRFIVQETLGRAVKEAWADALAQLPQSASEPGPADPVWLPVWHDYRERIRGLRVLDPACGSGAFLIAAFDFLAYEYQRINSALVVLGDIDGQVDLADALLHGNLHGVDLNRESVEITRLSLWLKTARKGHKLADLDGTIQHGNSVVSDPTLDPAAFDWAIGGPASEVMRDVASDAQKQAWPRWQAGFDVVLGNPPYVRQEELKGIKEHLKAHFACYDSTADLYVYFLELMTKVCRENGRAGSVCSDTWLKANFATGLRKYLATESTPENLIDLGDNQVFADAKDVNPVISVFRHAKPEAESRVRVANFVRGVEIAKFAELLDGVASDVPLTSFEDHAWHLASDAAVRLRQRVCMIGTQLGDLVQNCYPGAKTGRNSVFIVPRAIRDQLVAADNTSAEILRPCVTGEDLRPWYQENGGQWMVFCHSGIDIDAYPAVKAYLATFRPELEPKPKDLPEDAPWAGRKRGSYKWYELQDSVEYHQEFAKPKICWPDLTQRPRFSWDESDAVMGNTGFFITGAGPEILAVLQSRVTWFAISGIAQPLGERAGLMRYRLFAQFMERLPIPAMTDPDRTTLADLAKNATRVANARYAHHAAALQRIRTDLVTHDDLGRKLEAWWTLDFPAFREEIKHRHGEIPIKERGQWQEWLAEARAVHAKLTAELVRYETAINAKVYELFALTPDEIALVEAETRYQLGEM